MPEHEFSFTDPRDNPGYLLWQVSMRWQRAMGQALAPLGLTHTQWVLMAALRWLSRSGEHVTKSDVARHAHVDRMMASKVVRALAARGLVDEGPHPGSRRAHSITLTPHGRDLFARGLRVVEDVDEAFFDGVDAVGTLGGLLAKEEGRSL